jgi:hypothetical protein
LFSTNCLPQVSTEHQKLQHSQCTLAAREAGLRRAKLDRAADVAAARLLSQQLLEQRAELDTAVKKFQKVAADLRKPVPVPVRG